MNIRLRFCSLTPGQNCCSIQRDLISSPLISIPQEISAASSHFLTTTAISPFSTQNPAILAAGWTQSLTPLTLRQTAPVSLPPCIFQNAQPPYTPRHAKKEKADITMHNPPFLVFWPRTCYSCRREYGVTPHHLLIVKGALL